MIPNFFIVGAPKCGTTALVSYLSEHPNIFMSKQKEPCFWSCDIKKVKHEMRAIDLDEYLEIFKDANEEKHKVVGEGSTVYLRSLTAIPSILEFNPHAKFIVMLRNPVDVVQAFHMEQVYMLCESEPDFEKAWRLQEQRENGFNIPKNSFGSDHVLYRKVASFYNQISRFYKLIPENQREVIIFDDFSKNPKSVYQFVLNFLELQDDKRDVFPVINSAHAQRWVPLSRFFLYPPSFLSLPLRKFRMYLLDKDYKWVRKIKSFLNVPRTRQPVSDDLIVEIKEYFKSDVNALSKVLNRDLSHWTR